MRGRRSSSVAGLFLPASTLGSGEESDRLEEVGVGDVFQNGVFGCFPGSTALVPVPPQIELVGGVRRRQQLKDGEGDSPVLTFSKTWQTA